MKISKKAVGRLSFYRSTLTRFRDYGAVKIYSCDIAEALGYTAAQVRKDFSMFKFAGKKKVGYDVESLLKNIDHLLQKNHQVLAVLCGTGNNGAALFISQVLAMQGVSIVAAFDDPHQVSHAEKAGAVSTVPLLPLEELIGFITTNDIRFGIIASQEKTAQRMLDMLVLAGIKGVLNLTGTELKAPKNCIITSISIVREFENLVYFVNNHPAKKGN